MRYNHKVFVLLAVIVVLSTVFGSGCITTTPPTPEVRRISSIGTANGPSLSREVVLQLNYSEIGTKSQQFGYTPKNNSEGNITVYIFTKMENNTLSPALEIAILSSNTSSKFSGFYKPEYGFPEFNLTEKKQWLTERVNEIATICNLTVNWTQVQWTVNYAD